VRPTRSRWPSPTYPTHTDCLRLRQTDVKAGHYERKVQALEQARDEWEAKYEEMAKKHGDLQKELQELEQSMGNI
jgi:tropomyosin, fungi type